MYALVGTDYGGDGVIRHFIDYYHDLGVPHDRLIFVLHHNPAFPEGPKSSEQQLICRLILMCVLYVFEGSTLDVLHAFTLGLWF